MADEGMRAALYRFLDLALRKDGESVAPFDPDRRKVADVLEATRAEAQLAATVRAPAWLDAEDHYAADEILPCANGLLHMPSRDLLALTPAFFAVNAVVFAYDPDAPEPREWLAFLTSLWPDDQEAISTLQEVFGLMLTAETRYEKILMLVGPKRSGKGTVARILRALRGHASVAGPTLSGLGGHFGMEGLIDKPVAIISDARIGSRSDLHIITERLLSISGEDALSVPRKNRYDWNGKLPTRFLILTNELPKLVDASGALASRFLLLVLTRSFFGREDLALTERLLGELPGILNWALEGRDRLFGRGFFLQPESAGKRWQSCTT